MSAKKHVLSVRQIADLPEKKRPHPLDPQAVRHGRSLGDATGLSRLGAHIVRVEPGVETTVFHYHDNEDELVYILSGRATLEIGDESIVVEAGTFAGFPVGGPAHSMRNDGNQDLVYLMIGESRRDDVTTYPRLGTRMVRHGENRSYEDL